jgi:hypothetical protein
MGRCDVLADLHRHCRVAEDAVLGAPDRKLLRHLAAAPRGLAGKEGTHHDRNPVSEAPGPEAPCPPETPPQPGRRREDTSCLAGGFTLGERAALHIIADECRAHGDCAMTIDGLAARAGIGRTTVLERQ